MPINIDLSPDADDKGPISGGSVDIWGQMDTDERERRSANAQIKVIANQLHDRGFQQPKKMAQKLYTELDDETAAEIRTAAIQREDDTDFIDRFATELLERCENSGVLPSPEPCSQSVPNVVLLDPAVELVSTMPSAHAAKTVSDIPISKLLPSKTLEIPKEATHLTADYSVTADTTQESTHQ